MANNKSIVSDKNLKAASGGEVKFNDKTKKWDVIDNDDKSKVIYSTEDKHAANVGDLLYHHGKKMGYLDGYEKGLDKGMDTIVSRLNNGKHR